MNLPIVSILSLIIDIYRKKKFIRETVLPLVRDVNHMPDYEQRRQFVISHLMNGNGLSESEARFYTEAAVKLHKKIAKKLKKLQNDGVGE